MNTLQAGIFQHRNKQQAHAVCLHSLDPAHQPGKQAAASAPASGRRPSPATAAPRSCGQPAPPSPARRACLDGGRRQAEQVVGCVHCNFGVLVRSPKWASSIVAAMSLSTLPHACPSKLALPQSLSPLERARLSAPSLPCLNCFRPNCAATTELIAFWYCRAASGGAAAWQSGSVHCDVRRLHVCVPRPHQLTTASGKMRKQPAPPADSTRTQPVANSPDM